MDSMESIAPGQAQRKEAWHLKIHLPKESGLSGAQARLSLGFVSAGDAASVIDKATRLRQSVPMITHVVIFWTSQADESSTTALFEGARQLETIPGVKNFRCGLPVPSPREVVDDSFQVAISMDFDDQSAADAYQSHPDHVKFVEEVFKKYAARCVVYDYAS